MGWDCGGTTVTSVIFLSAILAVVLYMANEERRRSSSLELEPLNA